MSIFPLILLLGGCESTAGKAAETTSTPPVHQVNEDATDGPTQGRGQSETLRAESEFVQRGAPLSHRPVTPISQLLAHPKNFTEEKVKLQGVVQRACTKRGCWMEIAAKPPEPGHPQRQDSLRITFKNYSFFVPLNAQGMQATVEGRLEVKKVPKERVDHLKAEGARFPHQNADGSANELRIVATGVELHRG
ncbi:MAG: DUF4920 domain-containing protein [Polyangiaceae bacterium]|nr:DUF4920 domain-containing protein [Polyangiaceae bacterium]